MKEKEEESKKLLVSITEEELSDMEKALTERGVTCKVSKITIEGGVTLPDGPTMGTRYRKAGFSVEVVVGLDPTLKGSTAKMNTIHETMAAYVSARLKKQLAALSDVR